MSGISIQALRAVGVFSALTTTPLLRLSCLGLTSVSLGSSTFPEHHHTLPERCFVTYLVLRLTLRSLYHGRELAIIPEAQFALQNLLKSGLF